MTRKHILVAALYVFSSVCGLWNAHASGARDKAHAVSLEDIDAMIERKEYDDALLRLDALIKENPRQFDAAQKRISKILNIRELYANRTYNQYQLYDQQMDENAVGYTSRQIIELQNKYEPYYPDAVVRRYNAEVLDSLPLQEIWREGARLMAAGRFDEAAQTYKEGLSLYENDLAGDKYPPEITEPAYAALDSLDEAVGKIRGMHHRLERAADSYVRAVEGQNYAAAQNALASVRNEFAEYAALRNRIFAAGVQFQKGYLDVLALPEEVRRPLFFYYSRDLVMGRINGTELDANSGIIAAIDAPWNNAVQRMKNASYSATLSRTLARSKWADVERYALLSKNVNGLYDLLTNNDGMYAFGNYIESMDYIVRLTDTYPEVQESSNQLAEKLSEVQALPELNAGAADRKLVLEYVDCARDILSLQQSISGQLNSQWFSGYEANKRLFAGEGSAMPEPDAISAPAARVNLPGTDISDEILHWDDISARFKKLCDDALAGIGSNQEKMWAAIETYYASAGEDIATEYSDRLAEALELSEGMADGETGIVYRYPREAAEMVGQMFATMEEARLMLDEGRGMLISAAEYSGRSFSEGLQSVDNAFSVLDSINKQGSSLISRSQEQLLLAERARNEADNRLSQARSALDRENFSSARDNLERAREKYTESLSYQEDEELRRSSDALLAALGVQLNDAENKLVVREVRQLKDEAKDAYYAGDFDRADSLLSRAQARWAVTNSIADEEIVSLRMLVSTALSMRTGRVIPPEAPLYKEMSQILSLANQYYDKAQKRIKRHRDEAVALLMQAKDKLRELKSVYPLNQEASVLTLKIDRLIDPEAFDRDFAVSLNRARAAFNASGGKTIDRDNYANLLDLAEIEPKYPGLQDLIFNVQVALGIRQRPVENTSLQRSVALTQEAQRLFNAAGSDAARLRAALSQVDEAIRLNPNNRAATALKDNIQIRMGATATAVVTALDYTLYNQAVQAFRTGNIGRASDIIEQLVRSNPNSSQVKELKERIDAML